MQNFLARFLRIHPKEQKPFLLLALILFAMMAGLEITSNITEITFFHRINVESLPLLYLIEPPVIILLLLFLGTLLDRFGRFRLLFTLNGGLICGLLLTRALMQVNWPPIYAMAWLMQRIFFGTAPLVFWVLCSDVFHVRQSKRLFPIILTGSLAGAVLGNILTGILSRYLVAEDILLSATILFGLAIVAIEAVRRLNLPANIIQAEVLGEHKISLGLPKRLLTQKFLQALYLLMLIIGLLEPILRYQLSAIANQTFTAEQNLITFFGFVKAGGALVIVLFQLLIASRLVERLGVPTTLSILPIGFMLLLPLLGVFPNVIVGASVVASLVTLSTSFHGPARTSALNLFPAEERGRISAFADQLWYVGWFMGSGFLSWASTQLTLTQINFAAALFAASWIFILPSLKQRYVTACLENASLPLDQHYQELNAARPVKELDSLRAHFAALTESSERALRSLSPTVRGRAVATLSPRLTQHSHNAAAITTQLQHAFQVILLTAPLTEPFWGKIRTDTERGCAEAIFTLLELTHPPAQIRAVRRMSTNSSANIRAAGLEALDSLIKLNGAKPHLLMLLSDASLEEKQLHAQKWLRQPLAATPHEALTALSHLPDPMLQAWSRYHLTGEQQLPINKLDALRRTQSFGELSEEELHALALSAREHTFAAQKIIHEEGQPSQILCVIVKGEVDLTSAVRQETVRRLTSGNLFGDISVLSRQPYALTAMAVTEVTALIFDRETLQELTAYYPQIAFALMRQLALRLGNARGFWTEEAE